MKYTLLEKYEFSAKKNRRFIPKTSAEFILIKKN